MNLAAGQSVTEKVIITNGSRNTEKLRIIRSAGITAANGGSAFRTSPPGCAGPGCWVSGLPRAVTLPPASGKVLAFRLHVPRGTARGQYLAGITAEATLPGRHIVGMRGKAKAKAIIIDQVTVGAAITVGSPSRLRLRLRIPAVSAGYVARAPRLNIVVDNTGQMFARGAGLAVCAIGGRRYSYPVIANTILPRDRAVIPANTPQLRPGESSPCMVALRYGRGLTARWSGTVTLPPIPRARLLRTGNGVYSVVPAGGTPPWAIALLIIGTLILAVLVVLLVRTRRARGRRGAPLVRPARQGRTGRP